MTAVDVAALEAARAAATPGPWVLAEWSDSTILSQPFLDSLAADEPVEQRPAFLHTTASNANDAALIVAAVDNLDALLAAVRERDALRAAVRDLAVQLDAEAFGDGRGTIDASCALFAGRLRALLADVDR